MWGSGAEGDDGIAGEGMAGREAGGIGEARGGVVEDRAGFCPGCRIEIGGHCRASQQWHPEAMV